MYVSTCASWVGFEISTPVVQVIASFADRASIGCNALKQGNCAAETDIQHEREDCSMAFLAWSRELDTGIDIIDSQHKRIVEYINALHETQESLDRAKVGDIINELVDYTVSHFAFEESLMENAGYPFLAPHQKVMAFSSRKCHLSSIGLRRAKMSLVNYSPCFKNGWSITSRTKTVITKRSY